MIMSMVTGRAPLKDIQQQIAALHKRRVLSDLAREQAERPRRIKLGRRCSLTTTRIKRAETNASRNKVLTRPTPKEIAEHEESNKLVSPYIKPMRERKVAFAAIAKVYFIDEPEPF